MEKVSIVIPFYNCQYVDKAIESALNQTYKNIEVIVVDDGSSKYTDKINPYLKEIKYIQKKNGGTASALNTGIQHATGEYFSWLSSDDLYKPEKTSEQLKLMKNKNATVSYSPYIVMNSKGEYVRRVKNPSYNKLSFLKTFLNFCPINGCTVMAKMDLFADVGLFDETLRYANDYDMWCRILLKYDFLYINKLLVFYREHAAMGTKNHQEEIALETEVVKERYKHQINEYLLKEQTDYLKNLKLNNFTNNGGL
ncbi:hypothetical protein WQ54_03320 [Bacillus sp. SA1-12]|uniref:glycosyltransferase n=1 Tax=Bacillus sp. SA1-12 TaxID=1455638 RepID=UPI0006257535|nr:glycosyltransferase [Bacillus sp. SA1-12]KKI93651.1 hypothetical protein WQ54_03320 [Bacillus sp. SA1-12]